MMSSGKKILYFFLVALSLFASRWALPRFIQLLKAGKEETISATQFEEKLRKWNYWIQISDVNYQSFFQGKLLKIGAENWGFGLGVMDEKQLNQALLKNYRDILKMEYLVPGKFLVRFNIDLLSSTLVVSELEDPTIKEKLADFLANPQKIALRSQFDSENGPAFYVEEEDQKVFDQKWDEAKSIE